MNRSIILYLDEGVKEHLKKHWKKYALGAVLGLAVTATRNRNQIAAAKAKRDEYDQELKNKQYTTEIPKDQKIPSKRDQIVDLKLSKEKEKELLNKLDDRETAEKLNNELKIQL